MVGRTGDASPVSPAVAMPLAATCLPMRAHWQHLANTIEFLRLRPTRVHNPNGKLIGSAVFAQLTAESPHTL